MLILGRNWWPDVLRSVSAFAESVSKWRKACDKRLLRLINYNGPTKDDGPFYRVSNKFEDCNFDLFQDSSFTSNLQHSKSRSEGIMCIFGSHTLIPICYISSFPQQCRIENHVAWWRFTNTSFTSASVYLMRFDDLFADHVGTTRDWSKVILTVILTQSQKILLFEKIEHVPTKGTTQERIVMICMCLLMKSIWFSQFL